MFRFLFSSACRSFIDAAQGRYIKLIIYYYSRSRHAHFVSASVDNLDILQDFMLILRNIHFSSQDFHTSPFIFSLKASKGRSKLSLDVSEDRLRIRLCYRVYVKINLIAEDY